MIDKPRLIPRSLADFKWIRRKGIRAWLTWATVAQACDMDHLRWWQRLSRKLFNKKGGLK